MKRAFILFISLSLLASCSDDDDVATANDPILGTWFLSDVNNTGGLIEINECNKESFVDFKADGTSVTEFRDFENDQCQVISNDEGIWNNLGNSIYRFVVPFEGLEPLRGRVEFTSSTEFIFFPDLFAAQGTNIVFEKR